MLTPDPAFDLPAALRLPLVVVASAVAGVVNSIAGGGTLLTFPALVGLGISPIVANATSTVALWPGAAGSMWGYRRELTGMRRAAVAFALPSLGGGLVGAWLLLRTSPDRFAAIVPWLVLGATCLFMSQGLITTAIARRRAEERAAGTGERATRSGLGDPSTEYSVGQSISASVTDLLVADSLSTHHLDPLHPSSKPVASRLALPALLPQFLVAIYGGYFGAGVGILMLATLGFAGLSNIHQMNGLKNWGGLCMNAVAAIAFAFSDIVSWPVALAMAVGATIGGYSGSRLAQRVSQATVRKAIVVIGLTSGVWMLVT